MWYGALCATRTLFHWNSQCNSFGRTEGAAECRSERRSADEAPGAVVVTAVLVSGCGAGTGRSSQSAGPLFTDPSIDSLPTTSAPLPASPVAADCVIAARELFELERSRHPSSSERLIEEDAEGDITVDARAVANVRRIPASAEKRQALLDLARNDRLFRQSRGAPYPPCLLGGIGETIGESQGSLKAPIVAQAVFSRSRPHCGQARSSLLRAAPQRRQ